MARVRISNLTKRFQDVVAVANVSLEAKNKEFLVLLGPSGCGKTTILRCIAGLEAPDDGDIYIGGTMVNDVTPRERDVAMVFQSYALYPHMKVFDNIAFPLKMRKLPKDEIRKRVRRTAELLKIVHLLDRKPKQLSGGEAQRTALGRAIVREPKVFLMDEPLSNLDAKLRIYMRAELKRLQKDLKVTTIYVTHDQVEAMTMAGRIAIMNYGVLQQLASPKTVYDHPQNLFVAGFIGSLPPNFIDCTFTEKKGKYCIDAASFAILIPGTIGDAIKKHATSSELVIGIRSEDIVVSRKGPPAADRPEDVMVNIEGEAYLSEPLGSEIILDLKVGENLVKAKTPADFRVDIGDRIWLSFDINRIHIFDKKSEKSIV